MKKRKLKFKIRDLTNDLWGNPATLEVFGDSGELEYLYKNSIEYDIVQFINQCDKNGKEIYENMLLKVPSGNLYVVAYGDFSRRLIKELAEPVLTIYDYHYSFNQMEIVEEYYKK